jgi:hypothetical protein
MRLSQSDDQGHEFRGLTRVVIYVLLFIDLFFNQIFLITSFNIGLIGDYNSYFLSMRLFRSYDWSRGFDMLTQIIFFLFN